LIEGLQRNSTVASTNNLSGNKVSNDLINKFTALLTENVSYPAKALARKVAYQMSDRIIDKKAFTAKEDLYFLECYKKANKNELDAKLKSLFNKSHDNLKSAMSYFTQENILDKAVKNAEADIVLKLLKLMPNKEVKALEDAITQNKLDIAKTLLSKVNAKVPEILLLKLVNDANKKIFLELIKLHPKLVPKILEAAVVNSNAELIDKMLKLHPNLKSIKYDQGKNIMHLAVERASVDKDTGQKLLDVIFKNAPELSSELSELGRTPIHLANCLATTIITVRRQL
jgi:hypothetical protein